MKGGRKGKQKYYLAETLRIAKGIQKIFVAMGLVFNIGVFVCVPGLLQWF